MILTAADNGWIDGDKAMIESLTAFKRPRRLPSQGLRP
jgi:delta-aminolevulinic acid dehydratase/porphobilinogen synthase